MKKMLMLVVVGMFSVSAAAYACDGNKSAKAEKAGAKVVKKDGQETQQGTQQHEQKEPKKS